MLRGGVRFYTQYEDASPDDYTSDIGREATDGRAVYRIAGRIDASTSQDLESAVGPAPSGGIPRIIFDMREVTFISSARLGVIVMAAGSGGRGRPFDLRGSDAP
jgi:hypothetical protein